MNNNTCCGSMQRNNGRVWSDEGMSPFPQNESVAMAYVPFQQMTEVYSCEKGLMQGTMFPCLDKPFLMGCSKC